MTPLNWTPVDTGLPDSLAPRIEPTSLPQTRLLAWSDEAAALIGLDAEDRSNASLLDTLAGNAVPPGARPTATAYGGHQFGQWAGRLGDGRALTLGRLDGPQGSWDVQLKGAGPTPYSRGGDGRAVLRSSIREYLCSEAMHALGIPTTRALAIVGSPQSVRRETMETTAVVTRLAPSFTRFGHFEWLSHLDDIEGLRGLAVHVIAKHFPDLVGNTTGWLTEVVQRTARLMAQWQSVGFCHGVMNTDNFSILGLTLDYGPYGFIDGFNANHICNHTDQGGRYAYARQPQVGQWNCAQLLNACLPLLDTNSEAAVEKGTAILDAYGQAYAAESVRLWRLKLGLASAHDDDPALVNRWLTFLHRSHADFTLSFRRLATVDSHSEAPDAGRDHHVDPAGYDVWITDYRARLRAEHSDEAARAIAMNAVNPLYVLRNHLAQQVIAQAEAGAPEGIDALRRVLTQPFTEQPGAEVYAAEPPPELRHIEVSCSS
ncbi:MAG: YdiU family protein [Stagnimonas sp.]|nr:YdiU family protein [Stagnimonas sp.]